MIWLKFFLCVAIIIFAGTKLVRHGDIIAEKTGLGRVWIGLVFLAAVTSTPELVTGVSSVSLVNRPDLAIGTLLGSCLFNITIVALLDVLHPRVPVLSKARSGHIMSAGAGILFTAIIAGGILAGERFPTLSLGWVGIPTIIILVVYLVTMWSTFRSERKHQAHLTNTSTPRYGKDSVRAAYFKFALAAVAVILAGIWLSFIGDEMADTTGWDASFVGTLFLAISTSMPELVVAIAALRLGAVDMAIADILGANILDLAHLFTVDLFFTSGPVLSVVSSGFLIIAAMIMAMNLLVVIGLRWRQKHKTFIVTSWYSPLLIGLYIFGTYAMFKGISFW